MKSPVNAPAKRKKLFQNKNTSAQSTLGDTGSLSQSQNLSFGSLSVSANYIKMY